MITKTASIAATLVIALIWTGLGFGFQSKGGRDLGGPAPTTPPPGNRGRTQPTRGRPHRPRPAATPKPTVAPIIMADVTLTVSPSDATVSIAGRQYLAQNGEVRITSMMPGPYSVTVQHEKYDTQVVELTFGSGPNSPDRIDLLPLKGRLRLSTNLPDATISVGQNGVFTGQVNDLALDPGEYRIQITRDGYTPVVRNVTISPDDLTMDHVNLVRMRPVRTGTEMNVHQEMVRNGDNVYWIVELSGASGEIETPSGSLGLAVTPGRDGFPRQVAPVGMLTGAPCHVSYVPLDNNARIVIDEPPGEGNHWMKIRLLIYPRNSREPVRLNLNWQATELTTSAPPDPPMIRPPSPPLVAAATGRRDFVTPAFAVTVPSNWKLSQGEMDNRLTVSFSAPNGEEMVEGRRVITRGVVLQHSKLTFPDLRVTAEAILADTRNSKLYLQQTVGLTEFSLGGNRSGFSVTLSGTSPVTKKTELVRLYIFRLPSAQVFWLTVVNPEDEEAAFRGIFDNILSSLKF